MNNFIRVYMLHFDFLVLNSLISDLIKESSNYNIKYLGPIFLPTKSEKFNILRSPHVNKDSRDQLQISVYKRIMDFFNVNSNFIFILRDSFFFYSLDFNFKFLSNKNHDLFNR
ncbi:MAG: 30S ribosomal protein S10 [Candidatus Nasuia deltocephalinicola]